MEPWTPKYLVLEASLVLEIFNSGKSVDESLKLCDQIVLTVDEAILRIGYGKVPNMQK